MRTARTVLAAAAVAVTLAPAASGAAASCNLVVDPKGDQVHPGSDVVGPRLASADTDVVGGDLASNKRYVTAVIRLVSLREVDTEAPTGRSYQMAFTVEGRRYALRATYGADGYEGSVWDADAGAGIGRAGVVLDHAKREVRITGSSGAFGIVNGRRITRIAVVTGHNHGTNGPRGVGAGVGPGLWVGGAGASQENDHAAASRDYVAGSPSCVAVGR